MVIVPDVYSPNLYLYHCVCVCVGGRDTAITPAKTGEPVELLMGLWTRVGAGNHVLGRSSIPHKKGEFWDGCFPHSNALYQ